VSSIFDSEVNSFYFAYYGRPADPAGLTYWSKQLDSVGGNFDAIVTAFSNSDEAKARFGSTETKDLVSAIYKQLFNRAPEGSGLDFWTDSIQKGHVTLADAAIQIMGGAQGSDASLSALRLKAAESFTAKVASGGVQYQGNAAIEAARVLIKAVNVHTAESDVGHMVDAAAKLVNNAVANPDVLKAIATGTTMEALFDTPRGMVDSVALLTALGDVAQAAAGDPATLASLLRGGGMAQVLKVMPTYATLTDVVEALAKGGLPAAVDVVYPAQPPSIPFALHFDHVEAGSIVNGASNATSLTTPKVFLNYDGNLDPSASIEWRVGTGSWTAVSANDVDPNTKMVVINGLNLSQDDQLIEVRLVDPSGNATGSISKFIDGPVSLQATATQAYEGISLNSTVAGKIYLVDPVSHAEVAVQASGGGDAIKGTVSIGQQTTAVSGTVKVVSQHGASVSASDKVFGLGTGSDDDVSGQYVWAFDGNDTVRGTSGNDYLVGGSGNDTLFGGDGDDTLAGESGADVLVGGRGKDVFVFKALADSLEPVNGAAGFDVIKDFEAVDTDKIDLTKAGFVAHPTYGFTTSSTLHQDVASMVAEANTFLINYTTYGSVFVGQVGRDVYILGENHTPVTHEYTPGADLMIKLENVSVKDITIDDLLGITGTVKQVGSGSIVDGTGGADTLTGAYVRGFEGDDNISGTTGADVLFGGLGADTIDGKGGNDTIVFAAGDSNVATTTAAASGFDIITVHAGDKFDFGGELASFSVIVATADPVGATGDDLLMALNAAWTAGQGGAALVQFQNDAYVVVNNGDNVIDASDTVVKVVGAATAALQNGDILFA